MNQNEGGSESLSKVEKKENNWLNKAIIAAAAVILVAAVILLVHRIPSPTPASTDADASATEQVNEDMSASYILDKIEGSYDVKLTTGGELTSQGVARVKYNEIEGFDLIIYSEYRPVTYHFKADEKNALHSDDLGEGVVKYEEEFDQITITFTKEETICELSR